MYYVVNAHFITGKEVSTILVIEDSETQRLYLKAMLNRLGHQVIEACNGKQGIKLFDKDTIDLVMTDIFMPEKEGLSTIMELKEMSPRLKIIAMSAGSRAMHNAFEIAVEFGADACYEKPFEMGLLKDMLTKLLRAD